jgi:hypothetical protein
MICSLSVPSYPSFYLYLSNDLDMDYISTYLFYSIYLLLCLGSCAFTSGFVHRVDQVIMGPSFLLLESFRSCMHGTKPLHYTRDLWHSCSPLPSRLWWFLSLVMSHCACSKSLYTEMRFKSLLWSLSCHHVFLHRPMKIKQEIHR